MYPAGELTRLAGHKAVLQRAITRRRRDCAAAARRALAPLVWVDQLLALWRRAAPLLRLGALPLGWMFLRRLKLPRPLGWLLRWGPLAFAVLRRFRRTPPTTPRS